MSSAPETGNGAHRGPAPPSGAGHLRRAVFVDRDGTLNVDTHYLAGPEKVELYRGVTEGVSLLRSRGFLVVVITNQSGIARGLYTQSAVEAIHARIQELLRRGGTEVDAFYYCPHAPAEGCACRKPGTELFERAARDLGIDLPSSAMIGDRMLDVEAAEKLHLTSIYVPEAGERPHYPEEQLEAAHRASIIAPSFLEGCQRLLERL